MSPKFNADEIFEMTERIETNAIDFYVKAADLHESSGDVAFLRKLAEMERGHLAAFAEMRRQLPDALRQPPDDYPYLKATLYLNLLADAHGGEGGLSQADPLTAGDSLRSILLKAVNMEQRAIAFYLGLKEMVPANRGRGQINRIVAEEQSHIVMLAAELRKLTTA
jgi:rubrerythrin